MIGPAGCLTRRAAAVTIVVVLGLAPLAASLAADELGRLFTTAEQRRQLDAHRDGQAGAGTPAAEAIGERPQPPGPDEAAIRLRGVVYRADGNNTAWINSGNTYEGGADNGYPAVDAGRIGPDAITITRPGRAAVTLKVGERLGPAGPAEQSPAGLVEKSPAGPAEQSPQGPVKQAPADPAEQTPP